MPEIKVLYGFREYFKGRMDMVDAEVTPVLLKKFSGRRPEKPPGTDVGKIHTVGGRLRRISDFPTGLGDPENHLRHRSCRADFWRFHGVSRKKFYE